MARTWTLYDTETLPAGYELETAGLVAQNRDKLYFIAGGGTSLTNRKVFEYDIAGKSLTDISGGMFTGTYGVMDVCRFGTQIYAAYRYDVSVSADGYYGRLARWSGSGQTWADTWTMEKDGDPAEYGISSEYILEADFSNIYAEVYGETDFGWRVASSPDGVNFSLDSTPDDYDIIQILSDNQHSGYSSPLAYTVDAFGDSNNVVQRLGGSWSYVLGSAVSLSGRNFVGYTSDGYSIWRNTATGALSKSTDWGQNLASLGLTDTGFRTRNMQNLAGGRVIMLQGPGAGNQAYTWNFFTKQFDADGTTGVSGNNITTFFMDTGGGLYALCNDNAAETVTIYKAEVLDLKTIFYQTAFISDPTLNQKFALPFKGVNARALDTNFNDARALVGARDPSATPVVVSVRPYSGYQNHSNNHPTDTEIVKVGWL